ncbi:GntR family transcriptional regulator [Corynebacterium atypicum]|uniref:GntR family transcriptional regulator n=1 Tax=Corynebacterium atypicum TaxID=191610 RepID=A0ABM5QLX6_9CORY|nr:GntR family transcriptional regulator [Corynebacterium atypicum]AIG63813.1 GntR family transcriptional regulator [Corynebacterium atypicum]
MRLPKRTDAASKMSKAERAYAVLRERIRTREYEPGHRLVLATIAAELDMSAVPVREAIRQLEAEGMVTYETNVGARVSTLNREAYFETMESVAILEAAATAASVPHLGAAELAAAQELNEQMVKLIDDFDPVAFTELNKKFHRAVFGQCPNARLTQLVVAEWERLDYFRVSIFRYIPGRAAESVAEHEQMINLIETGAEPAYVEKVARNHRLKTSERYRDQIAAEKARMSG